MPYDLPDKSSQNSLFSFQRADECIGVLCMLTIVLSISWGVLTRYLFSQPAAWSFEVALMAFVWMVFFGAAAGVRLRMHAAVDTLVVRLPATLRRIVTIFNWAILLVLFVAMVWLFIAQAISSHDIATVALSLPRSVIYCPLAIACAMMAWHQVRLHPWNSHNSAKGQT